MAMDATSANGDGGSTLPPVNGLVSECFSGVAMPRQAEVLQ